MVGCAAVLLAASAAGVPRSPRVSVPSIPCVVSAGSWACAGVLRTASDSCFGGVCWGRAPPGVVRRPLVVGRRWSLRRGMSFLRVGPGARLAFVFLCASFPVPAPSWALGGFLPPSCVAFGGLSLCAAAPHFGPFRALLPECPFLSLAKPLPVPLPFSVWWWWAWGGAPLAKAWGWVAWSPLPSMCTPSRLPAPPAHFTQWRSSCKAGADHQAKWAGAWGGEGSELEVLERREEDVDMRR